MLRRVDVKTSWRSLDQGFWPEGLPAGNRTVVYGHNGSGKSTLSELLLSLAEGSCATEAVWEHADQQRTSVAAQSAGPSQYMAVFTRKWVETNLSAFLDGDNASAIVTLGREAIDAKEEEDRLEAEIVRLRGEAADAETHRKTAERRVEKLAREVQERIVSELKEFDYNYYTKSRFSITRVQDDLRKYKGDFPDSNAHAEALKRLGGNAPTPITEAPMPHVLVADDLVDLPGLLTETPTRVAIAALKGNPPAQTWVEQGLELHDELDGCLFCGGQIREQRRVELARHFDESWLRIRGAAKTWSETVASAKASLTFWHSTLPQTTALVGDLQAVYGEAVQRLTAEVNDRVAALEAIEAALDRKVADPSATPGLPDLARLNTAPSVAVVTQAISEHNEQARHHAEAIAERKQVVLDHLLGSQSEAFQDLERQAESWRGKSTTSKAAVGLAERRLDELRQAQFTTKEMAETLTRDLARVYGKDHLSVAVTADGKSYACRRGDQPGTDLSDGERTTLSLLYFLRKLEDEQTPGGDPSQRLVVIDDPSSSLDREALFATHQWLFDTLKGFGQYVVLTHDFNLLRLFIKSNKTAWNKSMGKIRRGDANEACFPNVSFLEMYAATVAGQRRSRVGKLPDVLIANTSEYAYLFAMVMAGVADSENHERLFLLPNAARRVLEVFASYKAPHRNDFLQQLEALVQTQAGEPYRDVYDFCNRFSHGEGNESVDVLDARAIHGQIRRCMDFLRAIDREHFERMCSATNIDLATFP